MGIHSHQNDVEPKKKIIKKLLRLLKNIGEGYTSDKKSKFSKTYIIKQGFINCICDTGTTWIDQNLRRKWGADQEGRVPPLAPPEHLGGSQRESTIFRNFIRKT